MCVISTWCELDWPFHFRYRRLTTHVNTHTHAVDYKICCSLSMQKKNHWFLTYWVLNPIFAVGQVRVSSKSISVFKKTNRRETTDLKMGNRCVVLVMLVMLLPAIILADQSVMQRLVVRLEESAIESRQASADNCTFFKQIEVNHCQSLYMFFPCPYFNYGAGPFYLSETVRFNDSIRSIREMAVVSVDLLFSPLHFV